MHTQPALAVARRAAGHGLARPLHAGIAQPLGAGQCAGAAGTVHRVQACAQVHGHPGGVGLGIQARGGAGGGEIEQGLHRAHLGPGGLAALPALGLQGLVPGRIRRHLGQAQGGRKADRTIGLHDGVEPLQRLRRMVQGHGAACTAHGAAVHGQQPTRLLIQALGRHGGHGGALDRFDVGGDDGIHFSQPSCRIVTVSPWAQRLAPCAVACPQNRPAQCRCTSAPRGSPCTRCGCPPGQRQHAIAPGSAR